jgi:hypothetical protein
MTLKELVMIYWLTTHPRVGGIVHSVPAACGTARCALLKQYDGVVAITDHVPSEPRGNTL